MFEPRANSINTPCTMSSVGNNTIQVTRQRSWRAHAMPVAIRNGPTTIDFLVIPSRYKTAAPPTTSPAAMIQSMSGNNLYYQRKHALPTMIRVIGKPASLMNFPSVGQALVTAVSFAS